MPGRSLGTNAIIPGFCLLGRDQEVVLVGRIVPVAGDSNYRRLRGALRRVAFLRNGWHLILELKDALLNSSSRVRAMMSREFDRPDHWGHFTLANERERLRREFEMLNAVRGNTRFRNALEVGCAEGEFTEMLGEVCDSLLAVDFSPVALARARQRCQRKDRVRFAEWDLLADPLPDSFDLIVLIHVLDYYRSPLLLSKIRKKLLGGLRPGGFLLLGSTFSEDSIADKPWWSYDGKRINTFMLQAPGLTLIDTATTELTDSVSYDILCQKSL